MIFALLAMLILAALCIVIWGGTEDEVGVQAGLGAVGGALLAIVIMIILLAAAGR